MIKMLRVKARHSFLRVILQKYKLYSMRSRWRRKYHNSDLYPMNIFDLNTVNVGKFSYGELNVVTFNSKTHLTIGNFVSIAQNVSFILDAEHYLNRISTFPFRVKCLMDSGSESFSKGDIIIDDDVWLGYGVTIMSGVHVGQGAVIAAGAVVTKDIPPYAIAGGIPARVIRYRFDENMRSELLRINYSQLNKKLISQHIEDLYVDLKDLKQLDWLPKKP